MQHFHQCRSYRRVAQLKQVIFQSADTVLARLSCWMFPG